MSLYISPAPGCWNGDSTAMQEWKKCIPSFHVFIVFKDFNQFYVFLTFSEIIFIRIPSLILILCKKVAPWVSSCPYISLFLHFSESTLKSRNYITRWPQVAFSGEPKRRGSLFRILELPSITVKKRTILLIKKYAICWLSKSRGRLCPSKVCFF